MVTSALGPGSPATTFKIVSIPAIDCPYDGNRNRQQHALSWQVRGEARESGTRHLQTQVGILQKLMFPRLHWFNSSNFNGIRHSRILLFAEFAELLS